MLLFLNHPYLQIWLPLFIFTVGFCGWKAHNPALKMNFSTNFMAATSVAPLSISMCPVCVLGRKWRIWSLYFCYQHDMKYRLTSWKTHFLTLFCLPAMYSQLEMSYVIRQKRRHPTWKVTAFQCRFHALSYTCYEFFAFIFWCLLIIFQMTSWWI